MVPTVSVDVPPEIAPNLQVGAEVTTGATVQERLTLATLKKPPFGVRVTVDVAVPPTATDAGERAEAASVKFPKVAPTV